MLHAERQLEIGFHDAQACSWRDDEAAGIHVQSVCNPMVTARIGRITTSHGQSAEQDHPVVRFGYDEVHLTPLRFSRQLSENSNPVSLHIAYEGHTVGPLAVTSNMPDGKHSTTSVIWTI